MSMAKLRKKLEKMQQDRSDMQQKLDSIDRINDDKKTQKQTQAANNLRAGIAKLNKAINETHNKITREKERRHGDNIISQERLKSALTRIPRNSDERKMQQRIKKLQNRDRELSDQEVDEIAEKSKRLVR